jgi:hypothetical protein
MASMGLGEERKVAPPEPLGGEDVWGKLPEPTAEVIIAVSRKPPVGGIFLQNGKREGVETAGSRLCKERPRWGRWWWC